MEPKCDYCATTQAIIYCKYDLAKLCLKCDVHVHSPNPLSRRHMRSLICEKCFSQPAVIRCLDQKVSYCQGCQWHVRSCSALGHRLQSLEPFSGCPSPTEFSRMWSSILESSVSSLVNPSIGSLPLVDPNNDMFEMSKINELDDLIGSSYSMMSQNITYIQNLSDQSSFFSGDSKGCPDLILKLEEGEEDLCEGLNLDNAPLNFDVGDDIICCSPQEHIESDQTLPNGPLAYKNIISVTDSNFTTDNPLEATSTGHQDCKSYHQSGPLFGQINPNIKGHESTAVEYQDCGMSTGLIMSDSPWESNLEVGSPQTRNEAKLRYKEKKLKRTFGKQIRYASRKARADTRKRVKGRFVKAGDNYDYDPSSPTTNQ
ncbi:zinc finger protein CONSTANS-LIKE 12 isoform X2 [Brassica rapa]|uniref:zinc finger protein CONSTANS-LIKE 12 isoform X2 n=1 Tax=Brassica campestris TaxID=3711 RepID=UPI00142E6856|nr:zinc finger protein CONSTANS-LIKE 12 isoform X2 [Brassica rapa]